MTRYRLSIYKSNKAVSAQIVDDNSGKTLASVQAKETSKPDNKLHQAELAGRALAQKAKKIKADKLYLKRGNYRYQGRVRAFCDALRQEKIDI